MENDEEKFPVLIYRKNGVFYGVIQNLRIIKSDEDISALYQKIQNKKTEVVSEFRSANLEKFLLSEPIVTKKRFSLAHWIILLFFLMIPLVSVTKPLAMVLHRCADMLKGSMSQKIISFSESLQSMPIERKKELRTAIHQIFTEIKPLSDEISSVWEKPLPQEDQKHF